MTPKENAIELVKKFRHIEVSLEFNDRFLLWNEQKQCALIAVHEIQKSRPLHPNKVDWNDCGATQLYYYTAQFEAAEKFWQEVKKEIEAL